MLMDNSATPLEIFIQTSLESRLDWKKGGVHRARRSNPFVFGKNMFCVQKSLNTGDSFMVPQESFMLLMCKIFWKKR